MKRTAYLMGRDADHSAKSDPMNMGFDHFAKPDSMSERFDLSVFTAK